jgi:hypothetical protein
LGRNFVLFRAFWAFEANPHEWSAPVPLDVLYAHKVWFVPENSFSSSAAEHIPPQGVECGRKTEYS